MANLSIICISAKMLFCRLIMVGLMYQDSRGQLEIFIVLTHYRASWSNTCNRKWNHDGWMLQLRSRSSQTKWSSSAPNLHFKQRSLDGQLWRVHSPK